MVENEGVLYLGWSRANIGGSRPSRLMLIQMRGWPNWKTNSTLAMAITALIEIIPAMNGRSKRSKT